LYLIHGKPAADKHEQGSSAAAKPPMIVLGVVSCPNVPPGEPLKRLAAQIAAHVQYHTSIGLQAILLYVRSNLVGSLVQSEDVKALILSRKLFLIQYAPSFVVLLMSSSQCILRVLSTSLSVPQVSCSFPLTSQKSYKWALASRFYNWVPASKHLAIRKASKILAIGHTLPKILQLGTTFQVPRVVNFGAAKGLDLCVELQPSLCTADILLHHKN
jgi:hypothetical protein